MIYADYFKRINRVKNTMYGLIRYTSVLLIIFTFKQIQ